MKYLMLAIALATAAAPALADDVTDAIQEGLNAYKADNLGKAAAQWEYAAQLARQAKAKKVTELLPKALSGWKAEKPDSSSAGAAMFGGGITVSQHYFVENLTMGPRDVSTSIPARWFLISSKSDRQ